jgi:uncharacterized protein (DUF983 family)
MAKGAASALLRGAMGRCPKCGEGKLFFRYLKLSPQCLACQADFRMADIGDGAAVFVIMLVGALVVPIGMVMQLGFGVSTGVTIGAMGALTLVFSAALLPIAKGVLFAAQWAYKTGDGPAAGPGS